MTDEHILSLGQLIQLESNTNTKHPTKLENCLFELIKRGNAGLFELEAFNTYGETCLHSTISTLHNRYGLNFIRDKHHHMRGNQVLVIFTRYKLIGDARIEGIKLLIQLAKRRGKQLQLEYQKQIEIYLKKREIFQDDI
ncbi:hypothetical protein [Catenovulum adriaticum]|uniref:Uncharacterized protein n=1 Tax=Catenovulum adriaticum TaxID=2984846 RepID=A0ABY7AKF2_9ALTE|nr:hypothetical protein [Catenovulum sp. TS8]WAJ69752.1 hypothetical protein OLW01_11390 [Catenovulum sp. TS8]